MKNRRSRLTALTLTWFLWDVKEPTPLKSRGRRPRVVVNLHPSHHSHHLLGGYSKLTNGLRAAASGVFVCVYVDPALWSTFTHHIIHITCWVDTVSSQMDWERLPVASLYADVPAYCSHVRRYCKRARLLSTTLHSFIHSFILAPFTHVNLKDNRLTHPFCHHLVYDIELIRTTPANIVLSPLPSPNYSLYTNKKYTVWITDYCKTSFGLIQDGLLYSPTGTGSCFWSSAVTSCIWAFSLCIF